MRNAMQTFIYNACHNACHHKFETSQPTNASYQISGPHAHRGPLEGCAASDRGHVSRTLGAVHCGAAVAVQQLL